LWLVEESQVILFFGQKKIQFFFQKKKVVSRNIEVITACKLSYSDENQQ
jgi:hypothetical protein